MARPSQRVGPPRRVLSRASACARAGEREVKRRGKTDCRNFTKNGVIHTFCGCTKLKKLLLLSRHFMRILCGSIEGRLVVACSATRLPTMACRRMDVQQYRRILFLVC